MRMLVTAVKIATSAHAGQNRKFGSGEAYITHPCAVADAVEGKDAKVVAMLHDVVEDTCWTLEDLRAHFSDRIVDAVDCLTKREGEPYMDFVERAKGNPLAKRVKVADIKHNMATVPEGHGLVARYEKALDSLGAR